MRRTPLLCMKVAQASPEKERKMRMNHQTGEESQRRRKHIEELKERIAQVSGCPDCVHVSPKCPDALAEEFLKTVLAYEEKEQEPLLDVLIRGGLALPAPVELSDERLGGKLKELIAAMALHRHYLSNTNHMSDRELYDFLWTQALREPTTILPDYPGYTCHLDVANVAREDGQYFYLKHYAPEEERERWAREYPKDTIPAHEDPAYDRDRHLPQP